MNSLVQKTMVLIKPDAMERELAGEIISRFEQVGLKIVNCKLVRPTKEFAEKHYPVTEEWYGKVGNNSIGDCQKYGLDPKEVMGTDDPIEMGKMIHKWNVDQFTGRAIIAIIFEGIHAIEVARKLAGPTVPVLAAPGTIRGDLTNASALSENSQKKTIRNLVHTSGDEEEAKREIKLWFDHEYTAS